MGSRLIGCREPKQWVEFVVDGKVIGVTPDSEEVRREVSRQRGTIGVEIRPAQAETMRQFGARSELSREAVERMAMAAGKGDGGQYGLFD